MATGVRERHSCANRRKCAGLSELDALNNEQRRNEQARDKPEMAYREPHQAIVPTNSSDVVAPVVSYDV
jgi:hypothetical protein